MEIRACRRRDVLNAWIVAGLCSCATTPADHHLQHIGNPAPATFQLVDDRPEADKQSRQGPVPAGVTQAYADDNLDPGPIALVRAALAEHDSEQLAGKTVSLTGFHAYVSDAPVTIDGKSLNQAVASTPGATPVAGALAALLIYGIEKLRAPKFVTVEITGKVQDAAFTTVVQDTYKGGVSAANLEATLHKAMDRLSATIAEEANQAPQASGSGDPAVKEDVASETRAPITDSSAIDANVK